MTGQSASVPIDGDQGHARLMRVMVRSLAEADGWLPFDRFMALALYTPGLGYYANAARKFGRMPQSGSDFVTAPELSALFGRTLAAQVAEALARTGTDEIWEFGAGSGALAVQLLQTLEADQALPARYTIVELSAPLQQRQRQALQRWGDRVHWASEWPARLSGVVVGNEVLDAMPVKLLCRRAGRWYERGVVMQPDAQTLDWSDRATDLRLPVEIEGGHDYCTEIHLQAEAFMRSLADRLQQGAAFLIDYGFPQAEYYHPQRHMGTLVCHRAHQSDAEPLVDVGLKDITAHVNFTGIALAAQEAGLPTVGYASQARFLMNCGIVDLLAQADLRERALALKLITEHEMGELFKVIALSRTPDWTPLGFAQGDRTHTL